MKRSEKNSGKKGGSNLATTESFIALQIKDVLNELWNSVTSNPQEYCLPIFDQEQAVSFKPFGCKGERRR